MSTGCLRCGSQQVMTDVKVEDESERGHTELQVLVGFEYPEATFFRHPIRVGLRANICGECGHVDLFVRDPASLWAALANAPPQGPPS